jgi:drug/metabolite transporter (DMT)-like permease
MALDRASLLVVQSLTALSLVIALPLGALLTAQHIGRRELGGALLTSLGIIVFITAGQPQGGTSHPSATSWWIACVSIGVLVGVLVGVGARFRGAARALTYGAAAGLGFGLQAAVTKTFVTEIGSGILALLSGWSAWVLILSALTGFALQQSALKTGVLAPAMASANSVTLFTSVVLGITVYGEKISEGGAGHGSSAVLGLIVAMVGIAFLAGSEAPQTGATDPTPAA